MPKIIGPLRLFQCYYGQNNSNVYEIMLANKIRSFLYLYLRLWLVGNVVVRDQRCRELARVLLRLYFACLFVFILFIYLFICLFVCLFLSVCLSVVREMEKGGSSSELKTKNFETLTIVYLVLIPTVLYLLLFVRNLNLNSKYYKIW